MTAVLPAPEPPVSTRPLERPRLRRRLRQESIWAYFRKPGWPLAVMLVPFPLWWAMGMSEFICMLMAIPMAWYLLRQPRIQVPRGFGLWLIFLVWVVVGVLVLQVSAAGAVPDSSSTRYFTWLYRLVWYLTVTISGLYVLGTRKQVSLERVTRIVSCLFLTVVAGGVLGLVAPHLQFPSLLELVLPKSVSSFTFIQKMIHPSAAQLQDVLGYQAPRPSAPYSYTNTWGMNFAATLPFFLYAWWSSKAAGWRRLMAVPILCVAAVTAVLSINRGLWVALIVMALFGAVRAAQMGRPAALATVVGAGVAVVLLVSATSLGTVVTDRLASGGSAQGRTNLSTLAVTSVTKTSPVIGLGSTRNVQGNFNTITGGSTPNCPRCSPPALGTQGQLWLVVFSQGLVGLAAYLGFFGVSFFRHLRRRSPAVTVGLLTIVASVVTMPVYDSLGTGLMVVMIGVGLLTREEASDPRSRRLATLGDYVVPVFRWLPLVLVFTILGGLVGEAVHKLQGNPATAVVTLVVPPTPTFVLVPSSAGPMSVDTLAQLLDSDPVLNAAYQATGHRPTVGDGTLSVRATSNSRTLHISYVAKHATQAEAGVQATAAAFLAERQNQLDSDRTAQLDALQSQAATLNAALDRVDTLITTPAPGHRRPPPVWSTFSLRNQSTTLTTQLRVVDTQIANVTAATIQPGFTSQPTAVFFGSGQRRVDLGSGLALGFLAGSIVALALGRRGRRARRPRSATSEQSELPVLATLAPHELVAPSENGVDNGVVGVIETAVAVHDFGSCLPVADNDAVAVEVAAQLENLVAVRRGDPRICVLVASDRTRMAPIGRVRSAAERRGLHVIGLVLVVQSANSRWPVGLRPKIALGRAGAVNEGNARATDRH